jgi:hypothetical protein
VARKRLGKGCFPEVGQVWGLIRVPVEPETTVRLAELEGPRAAPTVRSPARISPGSAPCSSRAATLTASPLTNELLSRARLTTTSPVLTPIRMARPLSSRRCIAKAV